MSRTGAPFLLTLTLLFTLAVAAQTTPPSAVARPESPQNSTPANPSPPVAAPQQPATPAPSATAPGEPSAQEQARHTLDRVSGELNLTADQKSKLEPILTNEIQLVHNLRADTTMTPDQKQAKFKDQLTSDHAKIDTILTPEQKQKLAQLNQQHEQQQQAAPPASSVPPKP